MTFVRVRGAKLHLSAASAFEVAQTFKHLRALLEARGAADVDQDVVRTQVIFASRKE